ncbi:uncharacterized protein LOC123396124 isoform X2 [Hordeum vulgare subsp. vulgare]|uniref:uncharacterized protein LOC123396124 isoform X2 n=1 Tax=Hordeum vulgare subsp. vulgare TaxID=112509 RepID=UPI001D1A5662|nr:uncharacterized protein LOC123396124 isoform X2 [Hordeum vulgare subsp. vulgare]
MAARRRRRVPPFGEWNYNYHHDAPEGTAAPPPAAWYATPEPEACSDVWFRYSPPPRKSTPKKHARRRPEGDVADAAAAKNGGSRRVVRPVDGDLYQVPPPPELAPHRGPRKTRSLWMGCLGLNSCVAS